MNDKIRAGKAAKVSKRDSDRTPWYVERATGFALQRTPHTEVTKNTSDAQLREFLGLPAIHSNKNATRSATS